MPSGYYYGTTIPIRQGKKHTMETRVQMSKHHLGQKRIFSDEHRKHLSLALKGKKYGKQSEEQIRHRAEALKTGSFFNCIICGKKFWKRLCMIKKGYTKFCSIKCLTKSNVGNHLSIETRQKQRDAKLGTRQSRETISKRNEWRKYKKQKPHSKDAKENCSKGAIKRILLGKDNYARGKKGDYFSIKNDISLHYRSLWELCYYKELEVSTSVMRYIPEPFVIIYKHNEVQYRYIPDILVEYNNGCKELVEIKPKFKLLEDKTQSKLKSAQRFCDQNGLKFVLLTEDHFSKEYLLQHEL